MLEEGEAESHKESLRWQGEIEGDRDTELQVGGGEAASETESRRCEGETGGGRDPCLVGGTEVRRPRSTVFSGRERYVDGENASFGWMGQRGGRLRTTGLGGKSRGAVTENQRCG